MMGDDENGDDLREPASSKRETLAHLVPRVVVRGPSASNERSRELGPIRDLTVREGCVVAMFDGGAEIALYGDADLWATLLAKIHAGDLVLVEREGEPSEPWSTIAAEVARRRITQ